MDNDISADQKHMEMCVRLGDRALKSGQVREAATLYEATYLMHQKAGIQDSPQLRHCLKNLVEIYGQRQKMQPALLFIQALRGIDDSVEARRSYLEILTRIAEKTINQGHLEKAELAYREIRTEAKKLLDSTDPMHISLNKAYLEVFKKGIKIRKNVYSAEPVLKGSIPAALATNLPTAVSLGS